MLPGTTKIYLTDKTGRKIFNTLCSTQYASSERRNLERHIMQAKATPSRYSFLDVATIHIEQIDADAFTASDDALLAELNQ